MQTNIHGKTNIQLDAEEQAWLRHRAGFQCPECGGVQVSTRQTRFSAQSEGFSCDDCGCQWGRDYYA